MEDLLGIALRISIMYLYVLTLLRLSGKRSIGQLSPLDFVVTTIIGDMFDDIFWAEIPLSQAVTGVTTIILLHTLISFIKYKSDWIYRLVDSTPTVVIQNGALVQAGMGRERMGKDDVMFELRLEGDERPDEIEIARVEPSGDISVRKKPEYEPAQKSDLPKLKEILP